jgi:hypothetical protein
MNTYRPRAVLAQQAEEAAKRERRNNALQAIAVIATLTAITLTGAWIDGAEYRQEAQNQNTTQSQQR